jgi:hypothetical protein
MTCNDDLYVPTVNKIKLYCHDGTREFLEL